MQFLRTTIMRVIIGADVTIWNVNVIFLRLTSSGYACDIKIQQHSHYKVIFADRIAQA
jgi:hypothetical protein